jgi:hypothetical protein
VDGWEDVRREAGASTNHQEKQYPAALTVKEASALTPVATSMSAPAPAADATFCARIVLVSVLIKVDYRADYGYGSKYKEMLK